MYAANRHAVLSGASSREAVCALTRPVGAQECGYNIKENRPVTPPPSSDAPPTKAPPAPPAASPPAASPPAAAPEPRSEDAAPESAPSSPRAVSDSVSVEADGGGASSGSKKVFSVKAAPKCHTCARSVYKTEEAQDAQGTVFHKECLRCKQCKASLMGREPVLEEKRVGGGPIRTAQYLVAKDGSRLGDKGDLFCDKHAVKATDERDCPRPRW